MSTPTEHSGAAAPYPPTLPLIGAAPTDTDPRANQTIDNLGQLVAQLGDPAPAPPFYSYDQHQYYLGQTHQHVGSGYMTPEMVAMAMLPNQYPTHAVSPMIAPLPSPQPSPVLARRVLAGPVAAAAPVLDPNALLPTIANAADCLGAKSELLHDQTMVLYFKTSPGWPRRLQNGSLRLPIVTSRVPASLTPPPATLRRNWVVKLAIENQNQGVAAPGNADGVASGTIDLDYDDNLKAYTTTIAVSEKWEFVLRNGKRKMSDNEYFSMHVFLGDEQVTIGGTFPSRIRVKSYKNDEAQRNLTKERKTAKKRGAPIGADGDDASGGSEGSASSSSLSSDDTSSAGSAVGAPSAKRPRRSTRVAAAAAAAAAAATVMVDDSSDPGSPPLASPLAGTAGSPVFVPDTPFEMFMPFLPPPPPPPSDLGARVLDHMRHSLDPLPSYLAAQLEDGPAAVSDPETAHMFVVLVERHFNPRESRWQPADVVRVLAVLLRRRNWFDQHLWHDVPHAFPYPLHRLAHASAGYPDLVHAVVGLLCTGTALDFTVSAPALPLHHPHHHAPPPPSWPPATPADWLKRVFRPAAEVFASAHAALPAPVVANSAVVDFRPIHTAAAVGNTAFLVAHARHAEPCVTFSASQRVDAGNVFHILCRMAVATGSLVDLDAVWNAAQGNDRVREVAETALEQCDRFRYSPADVAAGDARVVEWVKRRACSVLFNDFIVPE
ncbi:hypothetical protein H9P43_006057 [Blastocladiella emersonii ATCC 22665]|nr:hypothetical protein H9P43_006057 [Blastocladiella emersonii ATCC 22665]